MMTLRDEYRQKYEYRDGHLYHRKTVNKNFDVRGREAGGTKFFSEDAKKYEGKRVGRLHKASNSWRFTFYGDERPLDRAIYIYHYGQLIDGEDWPNGLSLRHSLEHIDGDPLNNRIENLRRVEGRYTNGS